jgi:hypothetical protein
MAGASGARSWLQAHHVTWLTPRRMRVATASIFVAATLGSTVALKGSSPPSHPSSHPVAAQASQQSSTPSTRHD